MFLYLDQARAAVLKRLLVFSFLRTLFLNKAERLILFSVLGQLLSLYLAVDWTGSLLILGPIVFGTAHLFSTIRYTPKFLNLDKSKEHLYTLLIALLILGVALLRTAQATDLIAGPFLKGFRPELTAFAIFLTSLLFLKSKKNLNKIVTLALALPLLGGLYTAPLTTALVLLYLHNFVGYFFWIFSAKDRALKQVALFSFGIFLGIQILVALGSLDAFLAYENLGMRLFNFSISYEHFGDPTLTHFFNDPTIFLRAVVIFAFSQSVHYSVWLKSIPESDTNQKIPLNFRQSWRTLSQDLSPALAIFALIAVLAVWYLTTSTSLLQIFLIYISASAVHGFIELAALARIFGDRFSK